eukprot:15476140-Alexandrium_andersonii.AAC.1
MQLWGSPRRVPPMRGFAMEGGAGKELLARVCVCVCARIDDSRAAPSRAPDGSSGSCGPPHRPPVSAAAPCVVKAGQRSVNVWSPDKC